MTDHTPYPYCCAAHYPLPWPKRLDFDALSGITPEDFERIRKGILAMSKQGRIKVVITEQLPCGHECDITYPVTGEYRLTLEAGPLTSVNPPRVLPELGWLFPHVERTLVLSGEHGAASFLGLVARNGRFVCAQCGAIIFALTAPEEDYTQEYL